MLAGIDLNAYTFTAVVYGLYHLRNVDPANLVTVQDGISNALPIYLCSSVKGL